MHSSLINLRCIVASLCLIQEIDAFYFPDDDPTTTTTTTTTTTSTRRPMVKIKRKVGDISEKKCKEYEKYFHTNTRIIRSSLPTPPPTPECCEQEIIGGDPAQPQEFPHMAHLGYGPEDNIKWQCAGTLISDQFVMTAAHCLYHRDYGAVKHIRLGDLNISTDFDDAKPQQLKVQQIIQHPDYKYPSHYNDIALVKLNGTANLNHYVRPACLHRRPDIPKEAIATGWGKTQFGGEASDHLQKVVLEMFSAESCNSSYAPQIGIKLSRGILQESQGDSGGPLQIYSNATYMYEVVGVTSFGKGCGIVNVPGVYTRVYNYLKWIEDNVWP